MLHFYGKAVFTQAIYLGLIFAIMSHLKTLEDDSMFIIS